MGIMEIVEVLKWKFVKIVFDFIYEVVKKGVKEEFMNWFYELFFYEVNFLFLKGCIRLN